jgi:hypothetical protein
MFPNDPNQPSAPDSVTPPPVPPPTRHDVGRNFRVDPEQPANAFETAMPDPFNQPQRNPNPVAPNSPETPPAVTSQFTSPQPVVTSPTSGADYLNQIAPSVNSRSWLLTGKMPFLIGGLLIVIIFSIIVAASNSSKNNGSEIDVLATRLTNVRNIIEYGESNGISASATRKVVAETSLVLASREFELTEIYPKMSKPDPKITTTESNESAVKKLDDAGAVGDLENAYVDALTAEINSARAALATVYEKTNGQKARDALDKAYVDLGVLLDRLETK